MYMYMYEYIFNKNGVFIVVLVCVSQGNGSSRENVVHVHLVHCMVNGWFIFMILSLVSMVMTNWAFLYDPTT